MEETSIKELFQGMVPTQAELLQGTVISASPLQIQAANDAKLIIGASIAIVPRQLTDYTTTVTITSSSAGGTLSGTTNLSDGHSHSLSTMNTQKAKMTVHNALKVGDVVHMLAVQNGKKYYILDRVHG